MANIDHQAWTHAGLKLRQCEEKFRPDRSYYEFTAIFDPATEDSSSEEGASGRVLLIKFTKLLDPMINGQSFAAYVAGHFVGHCKIVAEHDALFDDVFRAIFVTITRSSSALLAVVLTQLYSYLLFSYASMPTAVKNFSERCWWLHLDVRFSRGHILRLPRFRQPPLIFALDNGNFIVLPSFVLAATNLITEDIISKALIQPAPPSDDDLDLALLRPNTTMTLNLDGETVLHVACNCGANAAVKFFLEYELKTIHASQSTLLFAKDQSGYLPIHYAANGGHVLLIKTMLDYEARFTQRASPQVSFPPRIGASHETRLMMQKTRRLESTFDLALGEGAWYEDELTWLLDR